MNNKKIFHYLIATLILIISLCPDIVLADVSYIGLDPSNSQDALIAKGNYGNNHFGPKGYFEMDLGDGWESDDGLLQFDLSAYDNVSLVSATLSLFHTTNFAYGASFALYRNLEAWDQNTVTWNNSPAYDLNPVSILTISDSDYSTELYRSWDITSVVEGWLNGSYENYGLRFDTLDHNGIVVPYFASPSNTETNTSIAYGYSHILPKVTLEYNIADPPPVIPEPISSILFLTGGGMLAGRRYFRRRK